MGRAKSKVDEMQKFIAESRRAGHWVLGIWMFLFTSSFLSYPSEYLLAPVFILPSHISPPFHIDYHHDMPLALSQMTRYSLPAMSYVSTCESIKLTRSWILLNPKKFIHRIQSHNVPKKWFRKLLNDGDDWYSGFLVPLTRRKSKQLMKNFLKFFNLSKYERFFLSYLLLNFLSKRHF